MLSPDRWRLLRNDNTVARSAFDRALTLDRRSVEALAGLIALDFRANNTAAAKARIEDRLKADRHPMFCSWRRETYWTAQDFSPAEKVLRQSDRRRSIASHVLRDARAAVRRQKKLGPGAVRSSTTSPRSRRSR